MDSYANAHRHAHPYGDANPHANANASDGPPSASSDEFQEHGAD